MISKRINRYLNWGFFAKKKDERQESNVKQVSYSQCGEDLITKYVFQLRGVAKPSFIDIGAHHPFYLSNTALFYSEGCRGINIEANPNLIEAFNKFRTEDINLNVGISDVASSLDFYIMQDNTLSTFSKKESDDLVSYGRLLKEVKKVDVITISEVLYLYNKNKFPDFLNLDAEGMDLQILESIDFNKSSPKVICVEAADYSPIGAGERRTELIDYLIARDYYEYANTNLNAIMVRKDFWFI